MTSTDAPRRLVVLATAVVCLITSCGDSAPAGMVVPDRRATSYVAAHTKADLNAVSTIGVARTVVELLPNHLFEILDGNYAANTQSVLVGTPTAIQPEQALWWPDRDVNDGGDPKSVPFGEPAAMSRTWLVTLSVDRSIAGPSPVELLPAASTDELVTVRIQSDGGPIDVDRYRQGLLGLGRSVW